MNDQGSYGLWLVPTGSAMEELKKVVVNLAAAHASPVFTPHVTLVGSLEGNESEVLTKVAHLAAETKPFTVETAAVDFSTTYFQCVFARIKTSVPLLELYQKTSSMFSNADVFYMPHLSLIYGDFTFEERAEIAQSIDLPTLSFQPQLVLNRSDAQTPVEDWEIVETWSLGSQI
jgi:hypothetical protein